MGMRRVGTTHLAMRLQPRHARSRRCQLKAGTATVERALTAARAARALAGLDAHRHPSGAPLPARTTAWTSAARAGSHPALRAPAQRAVVQPRCWTPRHRPGWLPALRFVSGGLRPASLTCTPTSFFAWARIGAWTAPEQGRPLRRCGNPPGDGCAFASGPAPAGPARCPHGSGSDYTPEDVPIKRRTRSVSCCSNSTVS